MYQEDLQKIVDSFKGKLPESEDFKNFLAQVNSTFKKESDKKNYDPQLNINDAILVVENLTDMIALHEPDLTCTYISPACIEILGYEPDELRGMSAYDYFHPEDIPLIGKAHEELLKSPDGQVTIPYRLRRKNGEFIWVEAISKVIVDDQTGLPKKIIAAIRDITSRKRFEKELMQGQIRLELLNAIMEMRVENKPVEYIISYTLETLKGFFPELRISYTTLDERTGIQSLDYLVGFTDEVQSMQGRKLDLNHVPEVLKALKGKMPLIVEDAFHDERFANVKEYIIKRGTRSIAYFPARYDISSIGILSIGSAEIRELASFEISAFKEVSQQLGTTLREFRLRKERNNALQELSKREQELHTILENTPDIIVRCDRDLRYLYVNTAVERISGIPLQDFIGKTNEELGVVPGVTHLWNKRAKRVFKTGREDSLEIETPTVKGNRTFQIKIIPECNADNEVVHLLFVGRDITDRKNAEVSLRQSEERFRTFMDNIPHIAFIKDESGRYVYINRALGMLADQFSMDILLKTDYDWIPEEIAENFKKIDRHVLESGLPSENLELFKKDTTTIHFLTNKFLLKNAKGEKFVGGVSIDITERVMAEETIRENEARFRAIFETAGIGIVLASPSGYILKTNPAFENITGYTGKELSFMHIGDFTHPDDLEQSTKLFKRLEEKTENYYSYEKRYIRKNGEIIWGRIAASMVRTKEGTPMYVVVTVEDITTQRTYTDHLKNLSEELRFKNQELELAKENAERANKAKSIFLSSMSHELRTPLNAILGFAQILKKDEDIAPRQRGFIETMYKSGNHLLDMINDVLDISKIESGKMELFPDDFDLYTILNDTHDMFNHAALQKGIRFNVSYSPGVPRSIYGDAKRLRQILINLLSNALKFTQNGRISLHVTSCRDNNSDTTLCRFVVKDTGRGIPEEQIDVIFEPFRQMAGTYSEGSGLGLAISRRIAHLMNGSIQVQSTVDEGSVFTFTVPLKTLDRPAADTIIPREDAMHSNRNGHFPVAIAGEKTYLYAIANAILNLPDEFSEALADAVEVQDIAAIEFILNKALYNYSSPDITLLKQLESAAHLSDFKTLTHIAEILFKTRSRT